MTRSLFSRARFVRPHRHAFAALIPVVSSCCALAQPAPASTSDNVVVTGTREPLALDRLVADVVVIDSETLQNSPADGVADLLRREAGVQLSRNGGPGQSAAVFIRGASTSETAVFVDGVRIGSATLGSPSLEGLPLGQIDRIEVLRGPGSSLYGADAMGGVVNIITKRGDGPPQFNGHAAVGGYGSNELSLGGSGRVGMWDLSGSVAHEKSDGVSALRPGDEFGNYNPDRDGYHLDSAQAQVGLTPVAGQRVGLAVFQSYLSSRYDSSEYPPPDYTQDNTPDFRNHLRSTVESLDWRGALGAQWNGSAKIAHEVDDSNTGGNILAHYRTTRDSASAQLAWATGVIGQLVFAVDYVEEGALSSDIGPGTLKRHDTGALVELTGNSGAWSWQADARHDDNSDDGNVNTGRLGGAFAFAPGWKLRALAGSSFRAPTFNDLFYPSYGVSTLQPEHGHSVEVGLGWKGQSSEAEATAYDNHVSNLIAYESDPTQCPSAEAYPFGCAANIGRAALKGVTLSGNHHVGPWSFKAVVDWLDARDADTGATLDRRAHQQQTLGVNWASGPWSAGASLLHLGSRPDGGVTLAPETTLDLQAAWRFARDWSLYAKVLNSTDTNIEPARDYQGLGRQAWIGVRWQSGSPTP